MAKHLKQLPEQTSYRPQVIGPSKQLQDLIKQVPIYGGILLEDGKNVEARYFKSMGYEPKISLDAFLRGVPYAAAIKTPTKIYCPPAQQPEIDERINKIFDDIMRSVMVKSYENSVEELKDEIRTSENES